MAPRQTRELAEQFLEKYLRTSTAIDVYWGDAEGFLEELLRPDGMCPSERRADPHDTRRTVTRCAPAAAHTERTDSAPRDGNPFPGPKAYQHAIRATSSDVPTRSRN